MAVLIDYVAAPQERIIRAADMLAAGFVSSDLVWNKVNNYEQVINDGALAAWLVAVDGNLKAQSPPRNFGQLVVGEIYNHASAGQFESLKPKVTLTPAIANSAAETSLLTATYPFPGPMILRRAWRVTASGIVLNTSGAPVDLTIRLKAGSSVICSTGAVTLASDAVGQRVWRAQFDGEINFFLANGQHTTAHLIVDKGNTDPLQQRCGQLLAAVGTDPVSWDVTGQFSVANGNITLTCYTAHIAHSVPGTP